MIVRAYQRRRRFQEDDRFFGQVHLALSCVVAEVQPNTYNFAGSANWRTQARGHRYLQSRRTEALRPLLEFFQTGAAKKLFVVFLPNFEASTRVPSRRSKPGFSFPGETNRMSFK